MHIRIDFALIGQISDWSYLSWPDQWSVLL